MQTEQEKNWESDSLIFSTTLLVEGLCFCDEYDKKKVCIWIYLYYYNKPCTS